VFVAPIAQVRTLEWTAVRDLLLVAEVLSPSNPKHDRFIKRRRYQEARGPLYWVGEGGGGGGGGRTPGRPLPPSGGAAPPRATPPRCGAVHAGARGAVPAD